MLANGVKVQLVVAMGLHRAHNKQPSRSVAGHGTSLPCIATRTTREMRRLPLHPVRFKHFSLVVLKVFMERTTTLLSPSALLTFPVALLPMPLLAPYALSS